MGCPGFARRLWLAAVWPACLTGCGPSPPDREAEERIWVPEASDAPRNAWPDLSQREYVEVLVPPSPATEPDLQTETVAPRFVVNVTAAGRVQFKGNSYDFAEAPSAEAATAEFASFLGALLANPRWCEPDGTSRVHLMIHADRRARWAWIDRILRVVVREPAGIRHLQLATRGASDRDPRRLRVDVAPSAEAGEAPGDLRVRVATEPTRGDGESPPVQVAVGSRVVGGFPSARYDDPVFLAAIDRTWRAVRAGIRAGGAGRRASLEIATPDVPWAYVVTVVALLRQAGVEEIGLAGSALVLHAPGDAPAPLATPLDHDGPGVGLLLASIAGAAMVALLTLAPLRRRRSSARG